MQSDGRTKARRKTRLDLMNIRCKRKVLSFYCSGLPPLGYKYSSIALAPSPSFIISLYLLRYRNRGSTYVQSLFQQTCTP